MNYTNKLFLAFLFLFACTFTTLSAQSEASADEAKSENLKVLGDPGKGLFFVAYELPQDAKKVIWTVTSEDGEVLIKEKFKKVKAGKQRFQYNYVHGPDGLHTFKIVADGVEIDSIEVLKKKK